MAPQELETNFYFKYWGGGGGGNVKKCSPNEHLRLRRQLKSLFQIFFTIFYNKVLWFFRSFDPQVTTVFEDWCPKAVCFELARVYTIDNK